MNIIKKELKKGDYLFLQGEESTSICALVRGELEVIVVHSRGKITKEMVDKEGEIIDIIDNPNQTIGEVGAILNKPRGASIRAKSNSVVSIIPVEKDLLKKMININRQIGLNIIKELTIRVQRASKLIFEIEKKKIAFIEFIPEAIKFFISELNQISESRLEFPIDESKKIINSITTEIKNYLKGYETYLKLKRLKNDEPQKTEYKVNDIVIPFGKYTDNFYLFLQGELAFNIGTNFIFKCSDKYAVIGNYFTLFDPNNPANDGICYFTVYTTKKSLLKTLTKMDLTKTLENNQVLGLFGEIASKQLNAIDRSYTKSKDDYTILKEMICNQQDGLLKILNILNNVINQSKDKFSEESIKSYQTIKVKFDEMIKL